MKRRNRIQVKEEINYPKRGFTLIEMLVVMAILGVISLSIYSTFNSGLKIWKRLNNSITNEDINIFFDKFSTDLEHSFSYNGITPSFNREKLSFPSLVMSSKMEKKTIGLIVYDYDIAKGAVAREVKDYSDIYRDAEGEKKVLLSNIDALNFAYYFYDDINKIYKWDNELGVENSPQAIKVELKIRDGDKDRTFTRTVSIPAM